MPREMKEHVISIFNEGFYNPDHYREHPRGPMEASVETNRVEDQYVIVDEVINFCLYSSVCKSFNLSFFDLMSMDYATYRRLRKATEDRDKKVDVEHKAILQKQDKLAEEMKNVARHSNV